MPNRTPSRTIGVLAIQGDVEAHARTCDRLGARTCKVLSEDDLDGIGALIIPGGESTTIAKGLERLGLYEPIKRRIGAGLPVLGTCAGAIMLAARVDNHPVPVLGALDATAVRNAYGTQVDSFADTVDDGADRAFEKLRCVFIRAPQLKDLGPEVHVLASVGAKPVLVQQGKVLAATFHPELGDDGRVHARLLELAG